LIYVHYPRNRDSSSPAFAQQLADFRTWFNEYDAQKWDAQIAEDTTAGRLDALADEALAALWAGRTTTR
jgi:hypothetical protein